jgi:AraC-like DNA-binding protein
VQTVGTASPSWDIAVPSPPIRLRGVRMAGFNDRSTDLVDLQMVPYPAVTVLIDLGNGILVKDPSGHEQRGSVVAGLAPRGVRGGGRKVECLQVRLSPLTAHAVLGSSWELAGTVVAFEDLWGRDAVRMEEQLRAARHWDDRFTIAEAALARRLEAGPAVEPEVASVWQQMINNRCPTRVERLAGEVGWSRKRLWSRFRAQIGITPKRAAQLIRFDRAAHRLAAGHSAVLAAAESGYADQSHLHRDVAAFSGLTPSAVAAAPWLEVDHVAWRAPDDLP